MFWLIEFVSLVFHFFDSRAYFNIRNIYSKLAIKTLGQCMGCKLASETFKLCVFCGQFLSNFFGKLVLNSSVTDGGWLMKESKSKRIQI